MTFVAKPFAAFVNYLLAREMWALKRLASCVGKTVRLSCSLAVCTLLVKPDGYFSAIDEDEKIQECDVYVSIPVNVWHAFLRGGQVAVMQHIKIEGDVEFAAIVMQLAEHLRWEVEEDLAQLIGDGSAWYIASSVRSAGQYIYQTWRNLFDSAVEYLLDENPQLVRHQALDRFNDELALILNKLTCLENHVEHLSQ